MTKNLFTALSVFALGAGLSSTAIAADPCKFYLGVEGGVNFSGKAKTVNSGSTTTTTATYKPDQTPPSFSDPITTNPESFTDSKGKSKKSQIGGTYGAKLGYNVTESLRTELLVGYTHSAGKSKVQKDTNPTIRDLNSSKEIAYIKKDGIYGTVGVIHDFNMGDSSVTPFIGARAGVQSIRHKLVPVVATSSITDALGALKTALVPAAGATVSSDSVKKASEVLARTIDFRYTADSANSNSQNNNSQNNNGVQKEISSKRKTTFLAELETGASYKISDGVFLDLTVRASFSPATNFGKNFSIYYAKETLSTTVPTAQTAYAYETNTYNKYKVKAAPKFAVLGGLRFTI